MLAATSTATLEVARDFLAASNVVKFNRALGKLDAHAVPKSTIDRLLSKYNVPPEHLAALEAAGSIVVMDDIVHCHPPALLLDAKAIATATQDPVDAEHTRAFMDDWDPCSTERAELRAAKADLDAAEPAFREVVAKAGKRRKMLWGSAVFAGGAQLAIISRLTYFDLDWDIMEPISYFIGTGTSLAFFAFMLRYGAECTPAFFDSVSLGTFAKDDAVVRYLAAKDRFSAAQRAVAAKELWAREGGEPTRRRSQE